MAAQHTSLAHAALFAVSLLGVGLHDALCRAESWADLKGNLTRAGLTPSLVYDGTILANAAGGAKRGATYLGNLHLQLDLDGAALIGVPGLTAYVDGLDVHGGDPETFVGDVQGVSDLEAPSQAKLYEAWVQYNFAGSRLSLLAGRYDVNTEFDRVISAGLFLNSSFGIGAAFAGSGIAGPSIFPDTALGARLAYKPTPNIVIRTAVLDGAPTGFERRSAALGGDGVLVVGEVAFLTRTEPTKSAMDGQTGIGRSAMLPPYRDKLAIGVWHYTARFADLYALDAKGAPVIRNGSTGYYLIADKTLYAAPGDDGRSISAFVQAGIGDARAERFGSYFGAGLAASGFTPGRPEDEIGLAVAMVRNGSPYRRAQSRLGEPTGHAETAIELAYLAPITEWLEVEPDLQYVIHPNTDPALGNALVFQLEFSVSL